MKNKKAPTTYTIEEVTEMLRTSMEDHDVGWAHVKEDPKMEYSNSIDPAIKATILFRPTGWNTTDKKFKITIEEA